MFFYSLSSQTLEAGCVACIGERESPVFAERFDQRTMVFISMNKPFYSKKVLFPFIEESREMYPMLIRVYHAEQMAAMKAHIKFLHREKLPYAFK